MTDSRPLLSFVSPQEGNIHQENPIRIVIVADATTGFRLVKLEYGLGRDPDTWTLLTKRDLPVEQPEEIFQWDLSEMPNGELTLRLYMESTEGTYAEKRLYLDIQYR